MVSWLLGIAGVCDGGKMTEIGERKGMIGEDPGKIKEGKTGGSN